MWLTCFLSVVSHPRQCAHLSETSPTAWKLSPPFSRAPTLAGVTCVALSSWHPDKNQESQLSPKCLSRWSWSRPGPRRLPWNPRSPSAQNLNTSICPQQETSLPGGNSGKQCRIRQTHSPFRNCKARPIIHKHKNILNNMQFRKTWPFSWNIKKSISL